ncbi:hypothetical protein K493DRAFT_341321 [Basidiobolus meristosporus CBS 931.73]|uniref:Sequence orphan n=1 Tax=Basidiobolus meristosporus CBS 931.73 TaxID=1314790 RepID=A0A1Y1XRM8_9FUNG|nr:hypothetical protein K493DRAFT_341321 [Basidiobolus meristosporus CBS 931.73]|eukprot:ORX88400.1 hypothetical protein K493DRAFT_341321 [Basidiobolus meristosporus CBS 931.73]
MCFCLFLLIVFVVLTQLSSQAQAEISLAGDQLCYDILKPWIKNSRVRVDCALVETTKGLKGDRVISAGLEATNMNLNFYCTADKAQCNKVQAAFDTAFKLISNVVVLKEPLTVNASFVHFCEEYGECNAQYRILGRPSNSTGDFECRDSQVQTGSAGPARTIVLTDEDGRKRSFPQALLKQKGLTKHPKFSPYDIVATFNADVDFWFEGDGMIKSTQSDFLFVIIHELIHGLGFSSAWMDYINDMPQYLTPNILISNSSDLYVFAGFVENVFDKFLVEYPSLRPLSEVTDVLNTFASGPGTVFHHEEEFSKTFSSSTQSKEATRMLHLSTTGKTLAFFPKNTTGSNTPIILETSLNPYVQGSSISHFDFKTYSNTADFLMRYMEDRGVSLRTSIERTGTYIGGPVGPQLGLVLQSLGYSINPNPKPISEILPKIGNSDTMHSNPATTTKGGQVRWLLLMVLITLWANSR